MANWLGRYCPHDDAVITAGSCKACEDQRTNRSPNRGIRFKCPPNGFKSEAYGRHFDTQRQFENHVARQGDSVFYD